MMFTTARLLILAVCAAASNVNIHHRILVPGAPELPFVERGVIDNLRFQPSSTLSQHWLDFETALESLLSTPEVDLDRVLYQVALEREGADRDVSSVKLVRSRMPQTASDTEVFFWFQCHIPLITFESIILHTPHLAQNNAPYAINYFVTPIPDDGACPRLGSGLVSLPSPFQALSKLNTTIIHKADTQPPQ